MLAMIMGGVFYHLFGLASMRSTVEKINHSPELGIDAVNLSTFSDAINSNRRLKVVRQIFQNLLLTWSDQIGPQLQKFRHLAAIDSTLLQCVQSAEWAKYRKTKNACKAHVSFDLGRGIPEAMVLSAGRIHDRKFFEVFLKKGWTYVVDRAYNVYSLFDDMIDLRIFFVTRLKSDAVYRVHEWKRVKRRHQKKGVMADEIIQLGSGANIMTHELRLVTFKAEDGKILKFLTNRFDLAPTTIAALYQARWGIELFFKFLKRTLRGARLLGRSEVGAEVHVLLALITDLLLKSLAKAIGQWHGLQRHVPVTFLRIVRDFLLAQWSSKLQSAMSSTFA